MSGRPGDFSPPVKGGYTADKSFHRRNWNSLKDYLRGRHIGSEQLAPGAVDSAAIAEGSINGTHVDNIPFDKISSGTLFAAGLIQGLLTASQASGDTNRLEIGPTGLTVYDASGNIIVSLPTTGGEPFFHGAMEATQLDILDRLTLRGTNNFMDAGSAVVMKGSQQDPPSSPSVAVGWEKLTLDTGANDRRGMFWDTAGGAGGTTDSFLITEVSGGVGYLKEFNAATGAQMRSLTLANWQTPVGVARVAGGDIYVLLFNKFSPGNWFIMRVVQSTFTMSTTFNVTTIIAPNNAGRPCIGYDATAGELMIANQKTGNGQLFRISHLNTFAQVQSSVDLTTPCADAIMTGVVRMTEDAADRYFISLGGGTTVTSVINISQVHCWQTNGTVDDNARRFTSESAFVKGLAHDGTRFWTHVGTGSQLVKHTNWRWTSGSSDYYAAYTWMDDNGTGGRNAGDYESGLSAEQIFTMLKRARVTVTSPTRPASATHVPKYLRISTDASQNLQSDSVNESTVIEDYNGSGAAVGSGGVAAFPASTNSEFRTQDGEPLMRANGYSRCRVESGTPTGNQPVTNDTDENCDFANATFTVDTDSYQDGSNDRVQLPFAGQYLMIATCQWTAGNGGYRELHLEHSVDGSAWTDLSSSQGFVDRRRVDAAGGVMTNLIAGLVTADLDDYLRLVVHHTFGANLNLQAWYLNLVYMGPD